MRAAPTDLDSVLEGFPGRPEYLIAILQEVQKLFGYITPEAMSQVCDYTGVPPARAWSVATFYKSFRLEPPGEHGIRVCLGTACHLNGGERIMEFLERELKVRAGHTSEDMKYSLERVNCLGACALAPVVVVDQEYLPKSDNSKLRKKLKVLDRQ